ncbi:MAG TPA: efflux RND transporter permease subunit, partial [Longimicrobium sp.]|nr:efflux RND transporter permease subunit [Longimicrobium sp.]
MIRFSIRRPVAVGMLYAALAALGVASWLNVPVELLPETELPRLRITAQWPGASPEVMEAFLTSPIEAAVQQVRGVERVASTSEEGRGTLEVEFGRGVDMDFARLELSEQLAALDESLPEGALRPRVETYVPEELASQSRPFLRYTLTGPFTAEALRTLLDETIAPELNQLEGVADVQAYGGRERVLEVGLDEARILALGLTPDAVRQKVAALEEVREAGTVRRGGMLYALAVRESAGSAARIRRLPLLTDRGRVVRLQDVAVVRDTYEEPRSFYRIDGQPAVSFLVVKEIGTNVVEVADRAKARMAEVERRLPGGARVILDDDESDAVRAQLTDLRGRALSSAVIVFVVLFFFLRSFRSAAIVFSSIAFAALLTLNLIFFGGLTLNVLTLMGLAMGFGLIIDNAVVVLENVFRHARTAPGAEEAAERGAREMVLPVLAATLTTIIVFIPFVYLQGELRLFYVPLAIVVGFTNLASLLVTFTFTPALAGRLLGSRVRALQAREARARPPLYHRAYAAMVGATLRRPWIAVAAPLLLLAGSGYLFDRYVSRGTVWRPWYEQESYIDIAFRLPRGEELERTDELVRYFETRLRGMPEVARFTTQVYPQAAQMRVEFPDSLQETAIPLSVKEQLEAYSHQYGGAEVRVTGYGPSFYGGGSSPPNYSIQVLGYNYERVREIAEDLGRRLQAFSRIQDVDTNSTGAWFERDKATEVVLRVDRAALSAHGLTAREVVNRVTAAVGRNGQRGWLRLGDEEVGFSVAMD